MLNNSNKKFLGFAPNNRIKHSISFWNFILKDLPKKRKIGSGTSQDRSDRRVTVE